MARNNRHNAAFVVGSVLGAVAGAAVALWKTPYTGEELRAKLAGGGASHEATGAQTYVASPSTGTAVGQERSIKDKVLSTVEKTLAPVVGVELGKTANASSVETPAAGEIRVNAEHGGTTMLRQSHAWQGETAAAGTDTGSENRPLGLSRDKVDADQWASAYGTSTDTTATTPDTPIAEPAAAPATTEPADTETATPDQSTTRLRRQRSWGEGSEDDAAAGIENRPLGLSRDKVDADEWAAAYGTAPESTSDARQESTVAESEAKTGIGAEPAFPGNDETGRQPADPAAPDSNVADVDRGAGERASETGHAMEEAASVESLTTPQTDRVPDSLREHDELAYHPFPKLGGKDKQA